MKQLSIIIVNYKTQEITTQCIDSLINKNKNIDYEIILIDNASTDASKKTLRLLKSKHSSLRLFLNKNNVGFAKAVNQGIRKAKSKYILLLNSDTIFLQDTLSPVVSWMDKHPSVGIASCSLLNQDKSVQGTGGYFPTLPRIFAWMFFIDDIPFLSNLIKPYHPIQSRKISSKWSKFFMRPHQQDWVTGAFLLTRKEVIDNIGKLDEKYFMYMEELDFCYRAKQNGWSISYLPQWKIIHLGGASGTPKLALISELTGMKRFYKKFFSPLHYILLLPIIYLGMVARVFVFGVTGKKQLAQVYLSSLTKI